MLHNLYNDIFDKHEFFGNCSFDGCKPATVFLIIFVLMVYFDICSLIMFQSKKKEKEKTRWIGNSSCTTQQRAL